MADETLVGPQLASASRIHIIGGPAAGKSTLARNLGYALDLPVHELDRLAFEGRDFHEQPLERRVAAMREIAASPRWVTEGIFVGWTEPLCREADVIIWLDHVAWSESAARTLLRTARGALREIRKRRGPERFLRVADYRRNLKILTYVLRVSKDYWSPSGGPARYPATRELTAEQLAPYADKVLHIAERRDVDQILESALGSPRRRISP
jgi:adenylate kinase family enzyme